MNEANNGNFICHLVTFVVGSFCEKIVTEKCEQ